MRPDIPIQEIVWRLEERLEEVVREFWSSAVKEGDILYPCPGKSDLGSFQVFLETRGKRERGRWARYSQGRGGNVLNLIAYALSGEIDHKPAYRDQATAAIAVVQPELDRLRAENEALRRVGNDALTILKFAFNRIHVLPRSRDTELANDIDKVLGRLRAALFAPALDGEGR